MKIKALGNKNDDYLFSLGGRINHFLCLSAYESLWRSMRETSDLLPLSYKYNKMKKYITLLNNLKENSKYLKKKLISF